MPSPPARRRITAQKRRFSTPAVLSYAHATAAATQQQQHEADQEAQAALQRQNIPFDFPLLEPGDHPERSYTPEHLSSPSSHVFQHNEHVVTKSPQPLLHRWSGLVSPNVVSLHDGVISPYSLQSPLSLAAAADEIKKTYASLPSTPTAQNHHHTNTPFVPAPDSPTPPPPDIRLAHAIKREQDDEAAVFSSSQMDPLEQRHQLNDESGERPIQSRPLFSLWDYLREELLSTDLDAHQELKWERVSNFLSVPLAVERVRIYQYLSFCLRRPRVPRCLGLASLFQCLVYVLSPPLSPLWLPDKRNFSLAYPPFIYPRAWDPT
jgi:hypothetical protein